MYDSPSEEVAVEGARAVVYGVPVVEPTVRGLLADCATLAVRLHKQSGQEKFI